MSALKLKKECLLKKQEGYLMEKMEMDFVNEKTVIRVAIKAYRRDRINQEKLTNVFRSIEDENIFIIILDELAAIDYSGKQKEKEAEILKIFIEESTERIKKSSTMKKSAFEYFADREGQAEEFMYQILSQIPEVISEFIDNNSSA